MNLYQRGFVKILSKLISAIHNFVTTRGLDKQTGRINLGDPAKQRLWEVSTSWILFLYACLYFAAGLIGYFVATASNSEYATTLKDRLIGYSGIPLLYFIIAGLLYLFLGRVPRLILLRCSLVINTSALCYLVLIVGPGSAIQAFVIPLIAIAVLYFPGRRMEAFLWFVFGICALILALLWTSKAGAILPLPRELERVVFISTLALLGISLCVVIVSLWWTKNITRKLQQAWAIYWHLDTTDYVEMVARRRRLKLTVAFSMRFAFHLVGLIILANEQKTLTNFTLSIVIACITLNLFGALIVAKGYFELPVSYMLVSSDALLLYYAISISGFWQSLFIPIVVVQTVFSYILGDIYIGIYATVVNSICHFLTFTIFRIKAASLSSIFSSITWESIVIPLSLFGTGVGTIYVLRMIQNLERELIVKNDAINSALGESEKLLLNILPAEVSHELKAHGHTTPREYKSTTVLFTDFVGFTRIAESMTATELVRELDQCFSYFDNVAHKYGLEKLKTIGDAYMAAGGIPVENNTHPFDCALAALEIQAFMNQMKEIKEQQGLPYWELRLGMHTGPLVAGVVGEKKFAYDVWGDTVNTASRMESSGMPGAINISRELRDQIHFLFRCEFRGKVYAKNKGEIDMFFLKGIRPKFSVSGEGRVPNDEFKRVYARIKNGARLVARGSGVKTSAALA